jgi:hypothetical protein
MALSIIWFNDASQLTKTDKSYKALHHASYTAQYCLPRIKKTHTKVKEMM